MTGKLIEMYWERRGCDVIVARSADVEEMGKTTQNFRYDSSSADMVSKRTPPEYKSSALRLHTFPRYVTPNVSMSSDSGVAKMTSAA